MIEDITKQADERMQKAITALEENFSCVRTGRANAFVLDKIRVDYYGVPTPINQMAAIKTPDAHMLLIEPWDKSALKDIEQAIQASDIGVTANNDGSVLRLPFPQLTEERRLELVKQCRTFAEESRVAVRNIRRDANNEVSKLVKEENLPEDDEKHGQDQVQKITDKYIGKIDEALKNKEAEVMEV